MATTTNFGWETPDDTDLVKDGALAMRTLGNAIDTSLVDLKGGTTGQILSKTSNTDMDFTWITNDTGDITSVVAGVGMSGGGTSGAVTLTNDMASTITAAGDIVIGTGSGTYDNLPIGTTGQILTADTTVSPYKVKWAAAAGGGKLLQVVQGTYATETDTTSSTYVNTGLNANITPSSTGSRVLISVSIPITKISDSSTNGLYLNIVRGSTQLLEVKDLLYVGSATYQYGSWSFTYVDSPSTTSSTNYKVQFRNRTASGTVRVCDGDKTSAIVLSEIGA